MAHPARYALIPLPRSPDGRRGKTLRGHPPQPRVFLDDLPDAALSESRTSNSFSISTEIDTLPVTALTSMSHV
jgi:hypothetical protein